jgi:amidase
VVPAGMAEGLPVGVQVMGGKYTELRCLAVAEAIEQRLGTLTPIDPVTGWCAARCSAAPPAPRR